VTDGGIGWAHPVWRVRLLHIYRSKKWLESQAKKKERNRADQCSAGEGEYSPLARLYNQALGLCLIPSFFSGV
jgi:hypothetical protein